jgi:hypothetical protein
MYIFFGGNQSIQICHYQGQLHVAQMEHVVFNMLLVKVQFMSYVFRNATNKMPNIVGKVPINALFW